MRQNRVFTLCCCLAALSLAGCSGAPPVAAPDPTAALPAGPIASNAGDLRLIRADGPAAPVAVLVFLPGAGPGAVDLAGVPELWAAHGFDIVTPRLAAAMNGDLDTMLAQVRAMTAAPLWLVGDEHAVATALDRAAALGPVPLSGVIETSPGPGLTLTAGPGMRECSESVFYADPGNGAKPVLKVHKSGNACPPGAPDLLADGVGTGGNAVSAAPPSPQQPVFEGTPPVRPIPSALPHGPRLIETSVSPGQEGRAVTQLASLIRSAS